MELTANKLLRANGCVFAHKGQRILVELIDGKITPEIYYWNIYQTIFDKVPENVISFISFKTALISRFIRPVFI